MRAVAAEQIISGTPRQELVMSEAYRYHARLPYLQGLSELGACLLVPDEPGVAVIPQRSRPEGVPVGAQAAACRHCPPKPAHIYPA